jgi:hypothetical protein
MFGQKITNTNEMLQCRTCYCADFALPKSGQLNEALNVPGSRSLGRHASLGQRRTAASPLVSVSSVRPIQACMHGDASSRAAPATRRDLPLPSNHCTTVGVVLQHTTRVQILFVVRVDTVEAVEVDGWGGRWRAALNMYCSTYVLSTRYLAPSECASRFVLQHSPLKCFALSLLKHISRCKLDGEDSMC